MPARLISGSRAFEQLAPEWDALVDRAMTATPFQRVAYQRAWWQHLGPGELFTIAVSGDRGELCAIGCFYLLDGLLYFNGCVEESDYLDLIAPAAAAPELWETVFDILESAEFPQWNGLSLCNIPELSPSREILPGIAARRGYHFQTEIQEVCPVIDLPETFEAYLLTLDKKQRHEIRRKMRRASAAAVEIVSVTEREQLEAAVEEFLRLLQLSTTEKEEWLNAERRAVFHDVAAAALADGTLQLLFLQRGGKNGAALFNFDYNGRIWVYNSGMDIVEFGQLSPGVVLTAGAIDMAIKAGREVFDFLRGNEEYKYRFGARDTTVHHLQIHRA